MVSLLIRKLLKMLLCTYLKTYILTIVKIHKLTFTILTSVNMFVEKKIVITVLHVNK